MTDFLSGANWGLVRKYFLSLWHILLTAEELEQMDTLAETRRRLLEKERSSYWAQFKSGLTECNRQWHNWTIILANFSICRAKFP
jgi:hypothetical protein